MASLTVWPSDCLTILEPGADFCSYHLLPLHISDALCLRLDPDAPCCWSRYILCINQSVIPWCINPTLQQFNQSYPILSKRITVLWNVELYCLWETLKSIHHITRGGSPCIILSCRGLFRVQSWASPNLELANRSKLNTITGKRLNLEQKNLCLLNPDWELCQDWLTDPIRWEPSVLISTARCS